VGGELESIIIAPEGGDVRAQVGWVDVAAGAEVLVVLEAKDSESKAYNLSAISLERSVLSAYKALDFAFVMSLWLILRTGPSKAKEI